MHVAHNTSTAFYAAGALPSREAKGHPSGMVKVSKRKPPLANFKAWRRKKKLTQARLAERLEVDQATVSRYERGEIDMTIPVVNAWADALGIEPEDFWRHPDAQVSEFVLLDRVLDARAKARWARIIRETMKDEAA